MGVHCCQCSWGKYGKWIIIYALWLYYLPITTTQFHSIANAILSSYQTDDDHQLLFEPQILIIHDEPCYLCPKCNAKYKDRKKVKYYLRGCGIGGKFPICGFICVQRRYLRDHMIKHNKKSSEYRRRRLNRNRRP